MACIVDGAVVLDQAELRWFIDHYGSTPWAAFVGGICAVVTHDRQELFGDPEGDPFTEGTARTYLADLDARYGPPSPPCLRLPNGLMHRDPLYAVALHYGKPAFGSHEHAWVAADGTDEHGDCVCGVAYADIETQSAGARP